MLPVRHAKRKAVSDQAAQTRLPFLIADHLAGLGTKHHQPAATAKLGA